jgi:hypothetical protein
MISNIQTKFYLHDPNLVNDLNKTLDWENFLSNQQICTGIPSRVNEFSLETGDGG